MIRFLTGIAVTIVTFYVALIYKSVSIGLLGFCQAVLLVTAFLFLLWYRGKISGTIAVSDAVVTEGEKIRLFLHVRNNAKIACMKCCCRICARNSFSGKGHRGWYEGACIYPGKNQYQRSFSPDKAGRYSFELKKIRIYDMTGLFYLERKCNGCGELYVLPEIVEVGVQLSEQTRNYFGESEFYDTLRPGNDRSEFFGIREFREGDRIQSIDWKLSAREDELYVREGSMPLGCPLVLFLENSGGEKKQESFLTVAASISFSLMDAGCPHFIVWDSGTKQDVIRYRVADEESYYMFFTTYLADTAQDRLPLEERYRRNYPNDHAVNSLVLREGPVLTLNGTVILQAGKESVMEKLRNLEIQI